MKRFQKEMDQIKAPDALALAVMDKMHTEQEKESADDSGNPFPGLSPSEKSGRTG